MSVTAALGHSDMRSVTDIKTSVMNEILFLERVQQCLEYINGLLVVD